MPLPRQRNAPLQVSSPDFTEALPCPVHFRVADLPPDATYPRHSHRWGELVYSFSGVMEVELTGTVCMVPPQAGLWLPPGVGHRGMNRQASHHASVYIAPELVPGMPVEACAVSVSPLLRSLLERLQAQPPALPYPAAQERLLRVVVDELVQSTVLPSWLPATDDALLQPVLLALQDQPGDNRSAAEWARSVHTTERTLGRRFQARLGMGLNEWRQRLRVSRALPLLEAGQTVEAIAQDLGYASTSAFIAMFRRLTGSTPDAFRRDRNGRCS